MQIKNLLQNKTFLWILLGVGSIGIIFLSFVFKERLSEFHSLGLFGIFLANFFASATFFIPAPGIATVVAGGGIYPPFFVGVAATFGAVVGDMGGYFIGLSGKSIITAKKHPKKYEFLIEIFKKWGGLVIFLFALIPNPFFDGIGLIAGGFGYPTKKFFLYLFIGRLVRNILLSFLGQQLL